MGLVLLTVSGPFAPEADNDNEVRLGSSVVVVLVVEELALDELLEELLEELEEPLEPLTLAESEYVKVTEFLAASGVKAPSPVGAITSLK